MQMNNKAICRAIAKFDCRIAECENHLEEMRPSFLYNYEIVERLDGVLLNAMAIRDMLTDMLEGRV